MTVASDLIDARAELAQYGRSFNDWFDDHKICLGMAIIRACQADEKRVFTVCAVLIYYMPVEFQESLDDVTDTKSLLEAIAVYNDCTEDDAEVFDLFEKVLADMGALG